MNRYRSSMNQQHQHRLLIDNLRHDEEGVYFLNGVELKRPNIISRRNNNNNIKYQVIQVHQPPSSSSIFTQYHDPLENISYIEAFGDDRLGLVHDDAVVPIELLSSNSFIVPDSTFRATEISLALEPTVVSQPVPPELPLSSQYDSTCVSQAISTPIVTPIVSNGSSSLTLDYAVTSSHPTVQSYEMEFGEEENDEEESSIPIQILHDNEVYLSSLPTTSNDLSSSEFVSVDYEEEPPAQSSNSNQMRIETQADGSLVLYLDGGISEEDPIDIGSDAEIIQTDTFPVRPNIPFELPSQGNDGQTESFILVPIDDQGNTVLVPTSSVMKTRLPSHRPPSNSNHSTRDPLAWNGSPHLKLKAEPEGERPKPFRYEFPEEAQEEQPSQDGVFMSMNVSSLVPQFLMDPPKTETASTQPPEVQQSSKPISSRIHNARLLGPQSMQGDKETKVTNRSPQQVHQLSPTEPSNGEDGDGVEETRMGTFKCKYCPRETRLRIGMMNHIKRIHKKNIVELEAANAAAIPTNSQEETIIIQAINGEDDQDGGPFGYPGDVELEDAAEPTFTLVSAATLDFGSNGSYPDSEVEVAEFLPVITENPPPLMSVSEDHLKVPENEPKPASTGPSQPSLSTVNADKGVAKEEIHSPSKSNRKRGLKQRDAHPPNAKLQKVSVEPILIESPPPPPAPAPTPVRTSPRKYPPSKRQMEVETVPRLSLAQRTIRTRSSATSGRCLRNFR